MKNSIQGIIYILFILLFGLFIFYFFQNNPELVDKLKTIPIINLLLLFLSTTISLVINGYFLKIITQPFGLNIKNHFWLSATTSLLNLVTPFRGGAIFRGWYLNKKYNLDIKDIFITIAGNYPINFFVNSFLGLLLLSYEYYLGNTIPFWGWLFFSGIFLGTLILFFIPEIKYKPLVKINNLIKGWHKITQNKSILFQSFFLYFLSAISSAVTIFLLLDAIGVTISFYKTLLIAVFSIFSALVNITPAGIGITEIFFVMAGTLVEIPIETMLLITIIKRGIGLFTNLFWGVPGKVILLKSINEKD